MQAQLDSSRLLKENEATVTETGPAKRRVSGGSEAPQRNTYPIVVHSARGPACSVGQFLDALSDACSWHSAFRYNSCHRDSTARLPGFKPRGRATWGRLWPACIGHNRLRPNKDGTVTWFEKN